MIIICDVARLIRNFFPLSSCSAEEILRCAMKKSEVLACSFEQWYSQFRHVTIKSKLLKLDDANFISYLIGEGEATIRLPSSSVGERKSSREEDSASDNDDDDDNWDESDESEDPSFPDLESQIKAAIKLLGGDVFPKLNWSAPRDATWISCDKTLKCKFVSDILLLVKSSDFALRDLTQPFLHCEDAAEVDERAEQLFLVLRQWRGDIVPNSEFRCFVKDRRLVGVCQRHDDAFFPFISSNASQISQDVQDFFKQHIQGRFPLDDFAFDVFRSSRGQVLLLDFGPWGRVTDSLMFDWRELNDLAQGTSKANWENQTQTKTDPVLGNGHSTSADSFSVSSSHSPSSSSPSSSSPLPIFRFVESDADMRPTRFASSAVPLDFHHLSTGEDPQKLIDFLNLQKIQTGHDDDED